MIRVPSKLPISKLACFLGAAILALSLPLGASAEVRKEGAWPSSEKKVDLEFDGKPSEGLKKLASEAGWSLVMSSGITLDEHDVHINVDDQPADAVLEALFVEQKVNAHRSGNLVTITRATGDAPAPSAQTTPATPPIPAVPPIPSIRGEDRNVFGNNLTIHKDEIVHTVTVTGGNAKIEGTVTGDLVITGGNATLHEGSRVVGNASVMGGNLKVQKGARIDGDVGVVGGNLKRDEGAIIGGKIQDGAGSGSTHSKKHHGIKIVDGGQHHDASEPQRGKVAQAFHDFGQSVTKMSMLFVFGCVLLALLSGRMEKLRVAAASRPMKSFALGLVGSIVGVVGGVIALTILCITIIGIPIAFAAVIALAFGVYAAVAAVLTTFGAAVIGHKTTNPYLHLLFGCAVFLVASSVPYVGGIVTFAVTMVAVGTLVSTKMAGFLERQKPRAAMI